MHVKLVAIPVLLAAAIAIPNGTALVVQQPTSLGRIVEVKGIVDVKRPGETWKTHKQVPAANVARLMQGDLVRVPRGSMAVVECSNKTKWTVPNDGLPRSVANACLSIPKLRF